MSFKFIVWLIIESKDSHKYFSALKIAIIILILYVILKTPIAVSVIFLTIVTVSIE
ncbi:MAG: hypothetical protein LBT10_08455 [Methanobrevibacter sp.]|nr:hypothetical protein [Methanobrevibacter sp.]